MRSRLMLSLAIALAAIFHSAAQAAPGTPPGADIRVDAPTGKPSAWKRAETDHLIVLSDGGEAELRRVTGNLERLHHLMSRLYRNGDQTDRTTRLTITLLGSRTFFRDLGLSNLRSQEGPYGADLTNQRYYDPREDGAVLALARADQSIDMNTSTARDRDCEDKSGNGEDCIGMKPQYHPPLVRSWEAVLYSAYAQHFILSAMPAAYPRWYLDGIGALFSTVAVHGNGALDYAVPPEGYKQVLRAYDPINIGDVVTGRYLDTGYAHMVWTPYHAWLVAHFFLYSNLKPERQQQFTRYMAEIGRGMPMVEAAKAFGNLRGLQRDFEVYMERPMIFARTDRQTDMDQEPVITTLSPEQAALVEVRIMMGNADESSGTGLARVRDRIAQAPASREARLLNMEAECRGGQSQACLAEADSVLAASPDNVTALTWKGIAQTSQAMTGPAANRASALADARRTLVRALQLDGQAPLPALAYFQSFATAGEPIPEQAMIGVARVAITNPAAPMPRLYLASELLREGKGSQAESIIAPVLHCPCASPEKALAERIFGRSVSDGAAAGLRE